MVASRPRTSHFIHRPPCLPLRARSSPHCQPPDDTPDIHTADQYQHILTTTKTLTNTRRQLDKHSKTRRKLTTNIHIKLIFRSVSRKSFGTPHKTYPAPPAPATLITRQPIKTKDTRQLLVV